MREERGPQRVEYVGGRLIEDSANRLVLDVFVSTRNLFHHSIFSLSTVSDYRTLTVLHIYGIGLPSVGPPVKLPENDMITGPKQRGRILKYFFKKKEGLEHIP
jgi:hypothetical protein